MVRTGSKPVAFNLSINPDIPGKLYGDELRIKQIFNNLLSNAFKYTQAGKVEWSLDWEQDGDSVWIISRIRDTGMGIQKEDLGKLFGKYERLETRSSQNIEGTGLGLSITWKLVRLMDGNIAAESEYGMGSIFTVRIRQGFVPGTPLGKDTVESLRNFKYTERKRDMGAVMTRVQLPQARVLIVDDVDINLEVARGMMESYGMQIDCVESGSEAIKRVREGGTKYNAIFMDHMMPGIDGIEATRIIREEIDTEYARTIPIIALTANAVSGNETMFLSRGFHDFLSKPIDLIRLDAVINRWLVNRE
jgi:CheY-like chemotaxis protein